MYELCSRWADKGGFDMSLAEFKQTLSIEKQYKDVNRLREQVFDVAKKELKESSDKWFEYKLEKVKSRSFNWVYVTIFSNDLKQRNAEKGVYPNVYNYLLLTFPPIISDKAMRVADKLADMQQLGAAWTKFRPIYDKYAEGEMDAKHVMNTTKLILREDFSINAD
jgi:plasmid replication initiation protein